VIVDSSAVVAIFLRQPGFEPVLRKLTAAAGAGIGTPTLLECGIVLTARLGRDAGPALQRALQEFEIAPIAFEMDHWREAMDAYLRFWKGRHPASLNFGDCCAYAVARVARQPLLCTGDDFAKTDLVLA
jgi:ribonuclease VapC